LSLNLKHWKNTNSTLQQKLSQLSSQLHTSRSENNRMHEENAMLKAAVDGNLSIFREEGWKASQDHIVALQTANQQLQLRLAGEIDTGKNSNATLKSQNSALQQEVARLANLLTQKNILLSGQARETVRSEDEVEKYRDLMEGKLAEVNGKVTAYEALTSASEREKTSLASQVEHSKIELSNLEREMEVRSFSSSFPLVASFQPSNSTLPSLPSSLQTLKSESDSKESELRKLRSLCKDQEKELHDFKTRSVGDVEKMLRHEIDAMNAKHSEELEKERVETARLQGVVEDVKEERDGGREQVRTG
jgi:hypothetical protein